MADTRIEIISDIEDVVTFDTIVRDTVSRGDVAVAEERIAVLEAEIAERVSEIELLKEKIAHAKEIIALADAKKLAEEEAAKAEEVIGG
jgi:hypothetical protein